MILWRSTSSASRSVRSSSATVDGSPVNHNPPKAYDSPFIQGDFGSGVITIRKDRRELLLDFTKELKMP